MLMVDAGGLQWEVFYQIQLFTDKINAKTGKKYISVFKIIMKGLLIPIDVRKDGRTNLGICMGYSVNI